MPSRTLYPVPEPADQANVRGAATCKSAGIVTVLITLKNDELLAPGSHIIM
eukprot:jgi/Botrbrau1/8132/Bobra.0308s0024.1